MLLYFLCFFFHKIVELAILVGQPNFLERHGGAKSHRIAKGEKTTNGEPDNSYEHVTNGN